MAPKQLRIEFIEQAHLDPDALAEVLALVQRAYGRDLGPYYQNFPDPTHILGYVGSTLVTHACWVTRHLQVGDGPILRTAYVELVATEPSQQGKGYATKVMEAFSRAVSDYDLAALCPDDRAVNLYSRLGWQFWKGPLSIRTSNNQESFTPEGWLMFLVLPSTPHLDPKLPLSAEWRPDEVW